MILRKALLFSAIAALGVLSGSSGFAQQRPAESWWVEKTKGGVFKAPMRPVWRLSELKKMHAGQDSWSQTVIKDEFQDVTYNAGKSGFRISTRMHPDSATVFVIVAGSVKFDVEGQPPVTGVRGSIVNVARTTLYSVEVTADALWVEVNANNYVTLYPAASAAPAAKAKGEVIKVAFAHTPGAYRAPNKLHWNLFESLAACEPRGARVLDDHQSATPVINYANPADDKCPRQAGGGGGGGGAANPTAAFNPKSTFGHMHPGLAEWWIVQAGHISGKFENMGEYHAEEGDVIYAPPMMWHQMGVEGPGVSVRLAMGGYNLINMNNTAGQ